MEGLALFWRGCANYFKGDWYAAVADFDRSIRIVDELGDTNLMAWNRIIKGYAAYMGGNRDSGIACSREGMKLADDIGHLPVKSIAYCFQGEPLCIEGETEEAIALVEKSLKCAENGDHFGQLMAYRILAMVAAQLSPPSSEEAEQNIQTSIRLSDERGARPDQAIGHFRYAEILHKKGDLDRALEQLGEAEKLFRDMEMTWWQEQAQALRAWIERGEPFKWFAPYAEGPPKLDG
jgi:tetratricopeptide (TPR) repeat protein